MAEEYKIIKETSTDLGGLISVSTSYVDTSASTITLSAVTIETITATTISTTTIFGDGTNLDGVITGATSVGIGSNIFNSISNKNIKLNSITNTSKNKIDITLSDDTLTLDVTEPNLSVFSLVVTSNSLMSGGASLVSGLTVTIAPLTYLVDTTMYEITGTTTVILTSGDSIDNRIDVIHADISGNTGVIIGIASPNPVKPSIDPSTQVEVAYVTVIANTTETTVVSTLAYDEKTGPPSEWTFTDNSVTISGDSINDAYSGTKSIEFSGTPTGSYFELSAATPFDSINQNVIQFAIKNKIAWPTDNRLRFSFRSTNDIQIGNVVDLYSGSLGFSSTNTSLWQIIAIPFSYFNLETDIVSKLRVQTVTSSGNTVDIFMDYITLQEGIPSSSPVNKWLNIRADDLSTLQATSPTDTLMISGGVNINTTTSGNKTLVVNLDDNISLTGLIATTISATTYQNLPTDIRVTGGTYNNTTGVATFTNNTGGTFNVSGLFTGSTDVYVTGFTYSPATNTFTINQTNQPPLSETVSGFNAIDITGLTVTNDALFKNNLTVNGNAMILGDVTILGTATTVNTQTLYVKDNIITINSTATGATPPFVIDSGVEVLRNSATTASLIWSEVNLQWEAGLTGSTYGLITKNSSLSELAITAHTHAISEIVSLQTSLNSKLDLTGGTLTGTLYGPIISATTISATTFYGNGINLTGILSGASFNNTTDTLTLNRNNTSSIIVTGITDVYLTGGTNNPSTNNTNLASISLLYNQDVTPGTYSLPYTNTFITGTTWTPNILTSVKNDGVIISTVINVFSGLTINGNLSVTGATTSSSLSATTLSGGNLTVSGVTFNKLLLEKVGVAAGASFAGNPKTFVVIFATNFPDTNYGIQITGAVNRVYTFEAQTTSGFTINSNSNTAFVGGVHWDAKQFGEV